MKKYKLLFSDLDGTLIETISGKTFPKGIWDMKFRFDVLDKLKELKPCYLFIVSNQGGIELGIINQKDFICKMKYIVSSIREYTGIFNIEYNFCSSIVAEDNYRKPNYGMLFNMLYRQNLLNGENIDKEQCLMIGDASGKEGDFSDSDKRTAENFGIDYIDVEDFLKIQI